MAATSRFFRANLGKLELDTIKRIEAWASAQPGKHVLTQIDENTVLHGEREDKPRKSHMVALRTTFKNWGESNKLEQGFLTLISRDEFDAATQAVTPQEPSVPSARTEPFSPTTCRTTFRESLSRGFDARAQQMMAALQRSGQISC